jgi:hypothetical protein
MPIDANPLPPLRTLQSALHRVTESLAASLAQPLSEPPQWSNLEWRLAPAVAAMHGVSPLLAAPLRCPGPPDWRSFLTEQHRHTLMRQQRIGALLAQIDERARSAGIVMVALKGAALHAAGIYSAGERPMADIDLLTHPADAESAVAVLLALSFHEAGTTWKHQGFEPSAAEPCAALGEHADNPVKIDLHHRIAERLPLPVTDLTDIVYPRRGEPGLNPYPSSAALMTHLLAHTAGSMVSRGLRMIQLCDIARMSARMAGTDWEALTGIHGREQRLWWAVPPLMLTDRYFPDTIPHEVLAHLGRGCPWLLRRVTTRRTLAAFSYSHLYIDPIPGVIWAQSATKAIRYVQQRVFPGEEQLAQMAVAARTGPWATEPRWQKQSQARRIVQWLISRPTRTETLQPVRAALGRAN